jgi:hypothetical protein
LLFRELQEEQQVSLPWDLSINKRTDGVRRQSPSMLHVRRQHTGSRKVILMLLAAMLSFVVASPVLAAAAGTGIEGHMVPWSSPRSDALGVKEGSVLICAGFKSSSRIGVIPL